MVENNNVDKKEIKRPANPELKKAVETYDGKNLIQANANYDPNRIINAQSKNKQSKSNDSD